MQQVLLICPSFFSYHRSIVAELESRGFAVEWWNDRPSEASVYKLLLRLFPRWLAAGSARAFAARTAALAQPQAITHVLVVKGEALSPAAVRALRRALPQARFTYYLWDGVENARGALAIAPLFDTVATFDPLDARRFGWQHRPLFARRGAAEASAGAATPAARYDWAFVGTLHSDRLKVLRRLAAASRRERMFAFGFVPGRLMWVLRHLTDWAMWRKDGVAVSTRPMAAEAVQAVVDSARTIVDIEHPRQRGLTMRSIETLLAGRKLVTTNALICDSDLFDESRVCIIDRRRPSIPPTFLRSSFAPLSAAQRARHSVGGWVDELLHPRV